MLKPQLVLLLIVFSILACTNSYEGEIVENVSENQTIYVNDTFGWEFEIPDGWVTMSKAEQVLWKKHGNNVAEKQLGGSLDTWKEILHIKKGVKINQFVANSSVYNPEIHGNDYELSKENRFMSMKEVFEKTPGVEVEAVRTKTEIDGVEFDTYNMSIKRNGEQKGYQILLEKKYENDEMLLIGIVVSETEKLEELRNALLASKFRRKN